MKSPVAVIGLGAMGSRLAANLLADGYAVTVFNRSPAAAEPLAAAGAVVAATPREALSGVAVALVAVADDAASRAVWLDPADGVLAGAGKGVVAVEASTVSPAWACELAEAAEQAAVAFLEAPMVGSLPQLEARALVHLVSGAPEPLERARPVLAASAGRIEHVGGPGEAATLKLIVNALLATQLATLAELLAVARGAGLDAAATAELLASLPVASPALAGASKRMVAGAFAPNFPVRLVEKDLRYLVALGEQGGGATPMARGALAGFAGVRAAGHGDEDIVAIATAYSSSSAIIGAG
jgi:3-hydroxyisobutyrate dehydrogenase